MMNKMEIRNRNLAPSLSPIASMDGQASLIADRLITVADSLMASAMADESLIVDDRSTLRPAQAVENRLSRLLEDAVMPISHLQTRGMLRSR